MRKGLYMFRHSLKLSQQAMADKIGVNRETYASIERGARNGSMTFWRKLQLAFNISDEAIGGLMRIEEEQAKNNR